jgi:hypothetical protein
MDDTPTTGVPTTGTPTTATPTSAAVASRATPGARTAEESRLERRRRQCRVSQRRYRDKKSSQEYNLVLDVNELRERVEYLRSYRELLATKIWSNRQGVHAAVLKAVQQYYAVFQRGLHNPEAGGDIVNQCFDLQVHFLRAFLAPEVQFMSWRGVDSVIEHWQRYTEFHEDVTLRLESAEPVDSTEEPVVVAKGELTVHVAWSTLEHVFPHLLHDDALVQRLLGQQLTYPTSSIYTFNERLQVVRVESQVNFLIGINALLQSTLLTSHVLAHARITESLVIGEVDDDVPYFDGPVAASDLDGP